MTQATENQFLGALFGMAIGDALGAPVRGLSAAHIAERFGRPDLIVPFLPKHFANAAILGTPATSGSSRVKTAIGRLAREVSGQDASKPSLLDRVLRR